MDSRLRGNDKFYSLWLFIEPMYIQCYAFSMWPAKFWVIFLTLLLAVSLGINIVFIRHDYQRQIVVAVSDGDSIDLKDGRRIRLLGVDAPEKDRCGSDIARTALAERTQGKHVRLTNLVTDDYGRQLAFVYVGSSLIQEYLIKEGLARYNSPGRTDEAFLLKKAAEEATAAQKGIFSPSCRPTTPPLGCDIKGNTRQGEKIYHLPGCKNYDQVIVDLSYGDSWLCSEAEATQQGFVKAMGC